MKVPDWLMLVVHLVQYYLFDSGQQLLNWRNVQEILQQAVKREIFLWEFYF